MIAEMVREITQHPFVAFITVVGPFIGLAFLAWLGKHNGGLSA
jgi:hypothetical protein